MHRSIPVPKYAEDNKFIYAVEEEEDEIFLVT
jgi:hypothetical protein